MAHEELTKLTGGMLRYRYVLDEDGATAVESFVLASIGAPYRERFEDEIVRHDWIVEYGRTLTASPFHADFVICTADAAI